MSCNKTGLPFPRGGTYADGNTALLDANFGSHLLGKTIRVADETNACGEPLVLRIVKADAALTNIGKKCVSYTAGKYGRNAAALCTSAGVLASIVDDAYATTKDISQFDLFYVIDSGLVDALAASDVTAGDPVAVYTDSTVKQATAGQYIIGTAEETYAAADTPVRIRVSGDLQLSDPAS